MSPRISPDRTTRGKASTAVRPPNLLVSPRVSSSAPLPPAVDRAVSPIADMGANSRTRLGSERRESPDAPGCVTGFDEWLPRRRGAGDRRSRGELRHHARGEELERAKRLTLAHAAEVHLKRRLDLAEGL